MWAVFNHTAFKADRNWIRDKEGRHHFMVAIKATFDIPERGPLEPAEEQADPVLEPEYMGDPATSSLRFDSDLGPPKPGTDVLVVGHACAPGERPVPSLPVSLRVAGEQKVLEVRGEAVFHQGAGVLTTTRPLPFVRMPIVYERAFGGADTEASNPADHRLYDRNPVGVGFATKAAHAANKPAPNVVYPGKDPAKAGPAGFGPIATHWSPRRELGGTYDADWIEHRKPLLPADYDARHELSAPADQRWGQRLGPGVPIEVVHMTPDKVLRLEVPPLQFAVAAVFGRRRQALPSQLSSVRVDTDARQVMFVWQASLMVPRREVEYLDGVDVQMA